MIRESQILIEIFHSIKNKDHNKSVFTGMMFRLTPQKIGFIPKIVELCFHKTKIKILE